VTTFEIKSADDLVSPELEARWASRRAAREDAVFAAVIRTFVEAGGPVSADDVAGRLRERTLPDVRAALERLDADDLIVLEEDRVAVAYPFSATPNAFAVDLGDGRARYACCAIDALGLAPMLGRRVGIRDRCHDCGEPLALDVGPAGPAGGDGMLVWVGQRAEGGRVCASL
jgi:Alkylmercury lyase